MDAGKAKNVLRDIARELRKENDGEETDEILALEAGASALQANAKAAAEKQRRRNTMAGVTAALMGVCCGAALAALLTGKTARRCQDV